jgi:hypothetical protein
MFILRMGGPGRFSAEEIMAAHAAHVKAAEDGGGCMAGLHGANTNTGWTDEYHAKAVGGRASLHEDAINILRANWDALPLTRKPSTSPERVKLNQSWVGIAYEARMLDHVLSCLYDEKVGFVKSQTKCTRQTNTTSTSSTSQETPAFLSPL